MTSHDVVALVRRQLQIKKVGHCGTLDPIATGLLILTLGRGTKIQDLLMSEDKEYVGTLSLGKTTDTQDRAGEVTEERPVPELTEENVRAAFDKYRGDFYQMPPMVSAIKQGGVPLYKLARQGKVVERKPAPRPPFPVAPVCRAERRPLDGRNHAWHLIKIAPVVRKPRGTFSSVNSKWALLGHFSGAVLRVGCFALAKACNILVFAHEQVQVLGSRPSVRIVR